MSLMESNRPDPVHIRALAARRGELPAGLAGCRPTCQDCYGPRQDRRRAALMLRGEDPGHNAGLWCRLITDLSPAVLGREITARPVLPRRVPNPDRDEDQS